MSDEEWEKIKDYVKKIVGNDDEKSLNGSILDIKDRWTWKELLPDYEVT